MTAVPGVWECTFAALKHVRELYERDREMSWESLYTEFVNGLSNLTTDVRAGIIEWMDGFKEEKGLQGLMLAGAMDDQLYEKVVRLTTPEVPPQQVMPQAMPQVDDDQVDWVGQKERDALVSGWGDGWSTALADYLAWRWGADWNSHPAGHRAEWLAKLVADGELPTKTMNVDMGHHETVDDKATTLRTSGFAGCYVIILLGPGTARTLVHVYSGHYPDGSSWPELAAVRAKAGAAHTAHLYLLPGYWAPSGAEERAFCGYFGLGQCNVVRHGGATVVEVDAAGNVTQ